MLPDVFKNKHKVWSDEGDLRVPKLPCAFYLKCWLACAKKLCFFLFFYPNKVKTASFKDKKTDLIPHTAASDLLSCFELLGTCNSLSVSFIFCPFRLFFLLSVLGVVMILQALWNLVFTKSLLSSIINLSSTTYELMCLFVRRETGKVLVCSKVGL